MKKLTGGVALPSIRQNRWSQKDKCVYKVAPKISVPWGLDSTLELGATPNVFHH